MGREKEIRIEKNIPTGLMREGPWSVVWGQRAVGASLGQSAWSGVGSLKSEEESGKIFLYGDFALHGGAVLCHWRRVRGLGSEVSRCIIGAESEDRSRKSGEEIGRAFYIGFAVHGRVRYCVIGAGSAVWGLRSEV